jgi:carbamoyl-phosphate synthase large subunit
MKPVTIMVSSAGRRVELIECFRRDAASLGVELRVVAIDANPRLSSACCRSDVAYEAPNCRHPDFVPFVEDIVQRESVRLIIPTIDTELLVYANSADKLRALGAITNISTPQVVAIARDKAQTAQLLSQSGIPSPRTARLADFMRDQQDWRWPIIVKPVDGSSSLGVRRLNGPDELIHFRGGPEGLVAQEFCDGTEYTVNLYFDRNGELRCAIPHRRIEVRAGEVSKGRTERIPVLKSFAVHLAKALKGCKGALCFQAIVDSNGGAAMLEINARFGGGFPLAHAAGARFSLWLLQDVLGIPSTAADQWRESVTMLRFDSAVFY